MQENIYVDIAGKTLVDSHERLERKRQIERPVYRHIIKPLYLVATNSGNENHVNLEAFRNVNREELMHYELNFSRMASVWPNTSLERSDYALTCVMYGIHLEDAKSLVQGFYGFNSTYVKMIEQRIARHRLSNEVNHGPFQCEYKFNSYFLIG